MLNMCGIIKIQYMTKGITWQNVNLKIQQNGKNQFKKPLQKHLIEHFAQPFFLLKGLLQSNKYLCDLNIFFVSEKMEKFQETFQAIPTQIVFDNFSDGLEGHQSYYTSDLTTSYLPLKPRQVNQ